ncbi:hypothetical protein R3P38DRAFT_2812569 [Favolaschia claudopus]|uniref:Uncharacterized protein n=1 Tax=Favolaschia claudopus TaxID=2862362 RepID=A0AAV9Z6P4_9AGAR
MSGLRQGTTVFFLGDGTTSARHPTPFETNEDCGYNPTLALGGGGTRVRGKYTGQEVYPYIIETNELDSLDQGTFDFEFVTDEVQATLAVRKHAMFIAARVPWTVLVPKLTRLEGLDVASQHGLRLRRASTAAQIRQSLAEHECECEGLVYIMRFLPTPEGAKPKQSRQPPPQQGPSSSDSDAGWRAVNCPTRFSLPTLPAP